MSDPNTMTLDECRDWLAKDEGWALDESCFEWWHENNPPQEDHPIPATLDAIADAFPEGWGVEISYNNWWNDPTGGDNHTNECRWQAIAHQMTKDYCGPDGETVVGDPCESEILARARLAVACRLAAKGAKR